MTIADQILYEDNHLLALNKLPGQIAQGDKSGDAPLADLVKAYIKVRDAKPGNVFCGVIHRLDRPVSGVILFAKTSKALSRMTQLVKERDFSKHYWAVVKNAPAQPAATLEDWLVKDEAHNKSRVVPEGTRGAKLASLDYRVVAVSEGGSTIRYVASWLTWAAQSRVTSSTVHRAATQTAAYRCMPARCRSATR